VNEIFNSTNLNTEILRLLENEGINELVLDFESTINELKNNSGVKKSNFKEKCLEFFTKNNKSMYTMMNIISTC